MATQPYRWFGVEEVGGVTVVRFTHRGILAGEEVEGVADQLHRLVDEEGRRLLLLNLRNVESLASAMLGRFLVLHLRIPLLLKGSNHLFGVMRIHLAAEGLDIKCLSGRHIF